MQWKVSATIQRETKMFLGADNEETAELILPIYGFEDWALKLKAYRKKNHITQTAMSRKISALEKELDVYLVYRDTRQVELTAAGQDFYIRAKEIIHLYDDTVKQVQDIQSDFQSELRIGVGVYDHVLLNQFLGKYVSTLQIKVKINCIQAPYPTLAKILKKANRCNDFYRSNGRIFAEF